MVVKSTEISAEVLAERYMTLKVQADKIKSELDDVTKKLLSQMKTGDKVETPEYRVQVVPGRSTIVWTETGKPKRKLFEQELITQGLMDVKIGNPFISGRFVKSGTDE